MDNEERAIEAQERAEAAVAGTPTTALIAVTQLPIIEERLREVKAQVEAAVAEAKSMVATADTVQAVKNRRAELNKQFTMLDDQRKAVKKQIMAPYDRFETVFKECVTLPFKDADAALKATVDGFESELKSACIDKLKTYYAELCAAEGIDWLPFMRAMQKGNIKISLADSKTRQPRKLMDALAQVVSQVALDRERIEGMEDAAEIMAEYKISLDVGAAIAAVQDRRKREQAAREEAERRQQEAAERAEMMKRVEAAIPAVTAPPTKAEAPDQVHAERVWPEFRFTVYNCTRSQLIGIRDYLKREGIQYE